MKRTCSPSISRTTRGSKRRMSVASGAVVALAATNSTRASTSALHMGAAWTLSSPGFSGKVQPPVARGTERACGCFRSQRASRGKSLVDRISTQHFPGKSVAAKRRNGIIGCPVAPVRQMRCPVQLPVPQPISPICDRMNIATASAWSGRSASIAGRCFGTCSPSRIEGHCPSTLPRFGRCWA
jgi:hypothetical protein